MTVETITRGEQSWKIMYGFGRLQRARAIFVLYQPDAIKRAQITNPNVSFEELRAQGKVTADDIASYSAKVGPEIVKIVLHAAPEWDGKDVGAYVDQSLPEDVGNEIVERVRKALDATSIPEESKKN